MERPGIDGVEFTITLSKNDEEVNLIIGEDIDIIDEPKWSEDGLKYTFKCKSEKAIKYFNDINR